MDPGIKNLGPSWVQHQSGCVIYVSHWISLGFRVSLCKKWGNRSYLRSHRRYHYKDLTPSMYPPLGCFQQSKFFQQVDKCPSILSCIASNHDCFQKNKHLLNTFLLKVWSIDQHHQQRLGAYYRCRYSGSTPSTQLEFVFEQDSHVIHINIQVWKVRLNTRLLPPNYSSYSIWNF